jgi:hypothetical protein
MTALPGTPVEWLIAAWLLIGVALLIVVYAWSTRHLNDPMSETDRWCSQVDQDLEAQGR